MAAAPHPAALIDTDVLIDAARGYLEASAFLGEQHQAFRIQISVISAMEMAVGSRNSTELSETKRFLEPVRIIPVDTEVSNLAYKLIEAFTLSHGLAIPDALIAATAIRNGLTLLTKNTRHFQMIPDLQIIRPY
jgi:predicted nucleic acid-binding protein